MSGCGSVLSPNQKRARRPTTAHPRRRHSVDGSSPTPGLQWAGVEDLKSESLNQKQTLCESVPLQLGGAAGGAARGGAGRAGRALLKFDP
ncbi:hypothetical protein EVAR_10062_1 [Eumeta japonica]|uniref:Uncharacterized protein n=1 Tax=Eumeta variegata TaxID=151549 RepID=A0A4C1TR84_EUMVA|nr:hypothetical protein EVAR_10062_1 [Eumeta japonica]